MTITLFDNEMNYLEQGTIDYMVTRYGIDKRNLVKGIKKYTVDYIGESKEITLIKSTLLTNSKEIRTYLKNNGIVTKKIGNFYYSIQDIEVRSIGEKDIQFMQGSTHSFLIYTQILTHQQKQQHKVPTKKYTVDYYTEKQKYLDKYKSMSVSEYMLEAEYNYFNNPRINDIKAKASYSAAHLLFYGRELYWFPIREKDIAMTCSIWAD